MNSLFSSTVLLAAVTAIGAGAVTVSGQRARRFTFYIEATGVTSGGTMKIQGLAPSGTWIDLDSRTISATGTTVVQIEGAFSLLRAHLTARTDGTYSVGCDSSSWN